jgi:hypothetical protein
MSDGRGKSPGSLDALARTRRPQPQHLRPDRAVTHGGHSEGAIAPLAADYLAELMAELPTASERVLHIQARRLARLELLGRFEDERGVLRSRKRGEPFPATVLAEKISSAYIKTHTDLEAMERERKDNGAADYFESERRALGEGSRGDG